MDSASRQSPSFARISSINVSQLDKINAIPNKTTDNILMDGLCQEDQLYLNALMDDELSDSDEDENTLRRSSAWSPMAQSPVIMNKRIKKLRPSYAVTMSLEDISYIRPSWGMSKGIKRIEIDKSKTKKEKLHPVELKENVGGTDGSGESKDKSLLRPKTAYHAFLTLLIVIVTVIIMMRYIVDRSRNQAKILRTRFKVDSTRRTLEVLQQRQDIGADSTDKLLIGHFGQEIPDDLRSDDCTCRDYLEETKRFNPNFEVDSEIECVSCLDWALRANMRIEINKTQARGDEGNFCYQVKWQSYDNLKTPLSDCYEVGEGQWFGLGDTHNSRWPLNQLEFSRTALISNLTSEFSAQTDDILQTSSGQLSVGSYVDLSLLSKNGIYLGDIQTDLLPTVEIKFNLESGVKELCVSLLGSDKPSQIWNKPEQLEEYKFKNNFLEYSICSNTNWRNLVAELVKKRVLRLNSVTRLGSKNSKPSANQRPVENNSRVSRGDTLQELSEPKTKKLISAETSLAGISSSNGNDLNSTESFAEKVPKSIGLLERAIFTTSPEFMPTLDGKTLRQHVDKIIKLGLSPILQIDTRWQTHVGSLKLNSASFPKSKLLFEILHNKGFKILLTIKPYIDTGIGNRNINQLLEAKRLCAITMRRRAPTSSFAEATGKELLHTEKRSEILRRKSFFKFEIENITIYHDDNVDMRVPYLCNCRASTEGSCAIVDLTVRENREWMINSITKSTLLTQQVDGIAFEGSHPDSYFWDTVYRKGMNDLIVNLFHRENIYTLPKYSANFNYVHLAPRTRSWDSLRSIINSVLNLNMAGISLVNPGSIWGDLKSVTNSTPTNEMELKAQDIGYIDQSGNEKSDEELVIRWLQVGTFLPILQFNDLSPIEKYSLQDMLQNLVKIRKNYVVLELKRNTPFTSLIVESSNNNPTPMEGSNQQQYLPLIQPVWISQEREVAAASEQFMVGTEILVAPILSENLRQRDIYLSSGFWFDELRQTNIRGGKWLRNYPVELNEIAWFTRTRR